MGERLGCGGECLDLLIWDFGEVAAEQLADACPVVLERDETAVGQVDQDHTSVVGLSVAAYELLLLELLDEAGHRRLSESFEFRELGDASWPVAESAQQTGFGAR